MWTRYQSTYSGLRCYLLALEGCVLISVAALDMQEYFSLLEQWPCLSLATVRSPFSSPSLPLRSLPPFPNQGLLCPHPDPSPQSTSSSWPDQPSPVHLSTEAVWGPQGELPLPRCYICSLWHTVGLQQVGVEWTRTLSLPWGHESVKRKPGDHGTSCFGTHSDIRGSNCKLRKCG